MTIRHPTDFSDTAEQAQHEVVRLPTPSAGR